MADYQKILDRIARGHPPEVQAKLDAIHARYERLWEQRRRRYPVEGLASFHSRM
jgi:hypothetical protein